MESLTSLAAIIGKISTLSRDILEEGMAILDQKDEVVDAVLDAQPDADPSSIEIALQEAVVGLLKDAEEADRDIGPFARALSAVEPDDLADKCPFLASVWYGDEYDSTGVDALRALAEELQSQYDQLTVENITKAVETILKPTS